MFVLSFVIHYFREFYLVSYIAFVSDSSLFLYMFLNLLIIIFSVHKIHVSVRIYEIFISCLLSDYLTIKSVGLTEWKVSYIHGIREVGQTFVYHDGGYSYIVNSTVKTE